MILDELKKASLHPSADEIYELVRSRLPRISLGTVYRNLEILSESGEIQKLELAGSQMRFDGNVVRHYHVRCLRCDKVSDVAISSAPPAGFENIFRVMTDYEIVGHRLEFMGFCPDCRPKGIKGSKKPRTSVRKEKNNGT
jgi:Fur family ferric uptake transcriptional regulator